jgi:glucose/arabinose dehydrogenase
MYKKLVVLVLMALMLLALAACSGGQPVAAEPTTVIEEELPTRAPTDAPRVLVTKTEPTATATISTPEATAEQEVTPEPTATTTPTPTITPVPDEWLTPAAHAPDVEQPAYSESECSDRFPCFEDVEAWEERIRVPDGFEASYFAYLPDTEHPDRAQLLTSITFGPDGMLYAATTSGNIYMIDQEGEATLFVEGLIVPTGIAFQPGTERMYVSSRVLDRNVDGEAQISVIENGEIDTLIDGLPCCYVAMHGPHGIAFGPDGYGYVGVGARADHGEVLDGSGEQDELQPYEATIIRFSPDGSEIEPYAFGFRNPYDIVWDANGNLWATDNGRDEHAEDDIVPDELHLVEPGGQHGYPYYECPVCFGIPDDVELVPTWHEFTPHAVSAGITTYLDNVFPGYYNSQFLTLWTALDFAQRVMRFLPDGSNSTFATGFAAPIDVTVGPDGALYVADYATGIIFKIEYVGEST